MSVNVKNVLIICALCALFIFVAGCISNNPSSTTTTTTTTPKCTELNQSNGSVLVTCYGTNVTIVNQYMNNGNPYLYSYPFLMPYYQPYFGYGYPFYAYNYYGGSMVTVPVVVGRSSYIADDAPIADSSNNRNDNTADGVAAAPGDGTDNPGTGTANNVAGVADENNPTNPSSNNAVAPAEGSDNPDSGNAVAPASESDQGQAVQQDNIAEPADSSNNGFSDGASSGEPSSGDNGGFGESDSGSYGGEDNGGFSGGEDSGGDSGGDGGGGDGGD